MIDYSRPIFSFYLYH